MADEKISQLDPVTDVLDTDDYVLARAGASKRITGASLKADLGGSSPSRQSFAAPNTTAVPQTTYTLLPWVANAGDDLLDLTDPLNPAVREAGWYTVTIDINCQTRTAASIFYVELDMDYNGEDAYTSAQFPLYTSTGTGNPDATLCITWYVPAGGVINAGVQHGVGGGLNFGIVGGYVVKIA